MTDRYIRSTDGDNADGGSTWALAKLNITGAANIDVAGDMFYVSHLHAESQASAISIPIAGTNATPSKVLCVNDGAEPPTTLADTAEVTSTGASAITVSGSAYIYGIKFNAGTGTSTVMLNLHPGAGLKLMFEKCAFKLVGTSANNRIAIGGSTSTSQAPATVEWKNCDVSFANVSQYMQSNVGRFHWKGGTVLAGSSAITGLISGSDNVGRPGEFLIEGVDLSNLAQAATLTKTTQDNGFTGVFRNCKLPAGWTGNLGTVGNPNTRIEMYNCDDGDTNYRTWILGFAGELRDETTLVKQGGAKAGAVGLSWKITGSTDAEYPINVFRSIEIAKKNKTVGVPITVTVDMLHDSAVTGDGALANSQIWLEIQYQGTSGSTKSSFVSSGPVDVMATPADYATSTATWTTTGMTTPVKQKMSVTFTPMEEGYILGRIVTALPVGTIYVDPVLQVS